MKNIILLFFLVSIFFSSFSQPSGFQDQLKVQGGIVNGLFSTTGIVFDKTGGMYAIDAIGKVWAIRFDANQVEQRYLMLDISNEVLNNGDLGLVSIVLDPNFLTNGYFYLMYSVNRLFLQDVINGNDGNSDSWADDATNSGSIVRVTRYTANINASPNYTSIVPNSRLVLIGVNPTEGIPVLGTNHGGGCLLFGNDGSLLVSTGDGGTGGDTGYAGNYQEAINLGIISPSQNVGNYRCQMDSCLNGKILRVNPETGEGLATNPLFDTGLPRSAQSRMWAKGFRNPFRMTLIPNTGGHHPEEGDPGIIVVGDVGSSNREEINTVTAPNQNFGWPHFEGIDVENQQYYEPAYIPATYRKPIFEYRENKEAANVFLNQTTKIQIGTPQFPYNSTDTSFVGSTIILGEFYQGSNYPVAYQNALFFTDFSSKWIKVMKLDANYEPASIEDFMQLPDYVLGAVYNPSDEAMYYLTGNALPCDQIHRVIYSPTNTPPIAKIEFDTNHGIAPFAVAFSAIKSYDPDATGLTYEWSIDNNPTFSTGLAPHFVFSPSGNSPQNYKVKLTVKDEGGTGLMASDSVYIYANNTPPVINSTSIDNLNIIPANQNYSVNLLAVASDAQTTNSNLQVSWTVAFAHNGHEHKNPPINNNNILTTLAAATCEVGDATYFYKIYLKVTDEQGLSTEFVKNIEINCPGTPQNLNFSAIPPQEITLNNISSVTASATSSVGTTPLYYFNVNGPAYTIDNIVRLLGKPGKVTLRATQHGNSTYKPALPVEQVIDINRSVAHYTINFDDITDKTTNAAPFIISASVSPTSETPKYLLISGPATITNNVVTLTGEKGTVKIRAYFEGNYLSGGAYSDKTFIVKNAFATEDMIIYGDALHSDWQNFSSISSLYFFNTTSPFINTTSIKVTNPTASQALDLRYAYTSVDTSGYSAGLSFWVYNEGNTTFPLQIQTFNTNTGTVGSNNINVNAEPNQWTHFQFEWSFLGNPTQVGKIVVRLNQTQTESLYFDEIRLLHCADMQSVKTGNWNDASVWSCGRTPIVTDDITINAGHTVSIPNGVNATLKFLYLLGTLNPLSGSTFNIYKF
jgi:glucose/arabinose dehydrogenase